MNNNQKLTQSEKRLALYFLTFKDIYSWTDWPDVRDRFFAEYPELVETIEKIAAAEIKLNGLIRGLQDEVNSEAFFEVNPRG